MPVAGLGNLVGGRWRSPEGATRELISVNPARPGDVVYRGVAAVEDVDEAVRAARGALPEWSGWSFERRVAVLRRFQQLATGAAAELATLIRLETGKAAWDARAEAQLLATKVDITLEQGPEFPHGAMNRVTGFELSLGGARRGKCWFRPHGVMAVVGPFNFPAHLPNGHIVPALAMGNTVVFKPADKTPHVGQFLAKLLDDALRAEGAPAGVVNMVQGGAEVGATLVGHRAIDGVLFTGSWPVGRRIMEANLDYPGRMLALEMGGNNAAVVMPDADLYQAVVECVRSAFVSSGQRCTCTRRLLVHESVAARVISALCKGAKGVRVGEPDADKPEHIGPSFMGPMISEGARAAVLDAQRRFARAGGVPMVPCVIPDRPAQGWYLTPGVMSVPVFVGDDTDRAGRDEEVFGPLLRIARFKTLDEAIEQVNATRFGLAASIFTKDAEVIERFRLEARAGCINVNTGTAGASSKLPFGGLGWSGNHRPAGAFSLDYCAYPVAGMIEPSDPAAATVSPGMTVDPEWVRDTQ